MAEGDNNQAGTEQVVDLREVGATGLRRFSGFIYDEFLPELTGWKGVSIYKEMGSNDPTIAAMLFTIRTLIRRVPWRVKPASQQPVDKEAADFLESVMNDMSTSWIDTIDEILSMLQYGYSVHEIIYKRRCGDGFDPSMRSKYSDGRIGWRKLPIRSQDTIYRWQFDDHGGIQGVEQLAPPHYYHVTIPVEKMLLFRTTVEKNNPEGRSILRGAYRPWYIKKNLENIEAIGIERDLAGLPVAMVPPEILSSNASPQQKAVLSGIKDIINNVRIDAQAGVIFPKVLDVNGKDKYEFKLMNTGGAKQFDTDKVVNRYDQRIAMTSLMDFLFIGHQNVGSKSLVSSRLELYANAIGAYLDMVSSVINRFGVPRLFALNDFTVTDYPEIMHGDTARIDLEELGNYIKNLTTAGMPLFPSPDGELENFLLKTGGMPERPKIEPTAPGLEVEQHGGGEVTDIPNVPVQTPTGLSKPSDTTPVNGEPPVQTVATNVTGNTEMTSRMASGNPQNPNPGYTGPSR